MEEWGRDGREGREGLLHMGGSWAAMTAFVNPPDKRSTQAHRREAWKSGRRRTRLPSLAQVSQRPNRNIMIIGQIARGSFLGYKDSLKRTQFDRTRYAPYHHISARLIFFFVFLPIFIALVEFVTCWDHSLVFFKPKLRIYTLESSKFFANLTIFNWNISNLTFF